MMPTTGPPLGVRVPIGPFDDAPEHLGLLLGDQFGELATADAHQHARVRWLVDNLQAADVALGRWDLRVVELVATLGPGASQSFIGLVMRAWPGAALARPPVGRHAAE